MEIYLNVASTTEPDQKVLDDFIYCASKYWHNASDISEKALESKEIIEKSQNKIAASINAKQNEIIFTSCGSEANNLAIKGYVDCNNIDIILTTEIEHPSVYNTCDFLEEHGCKIIYIPVDLSGQIILSKLNDIILNYCKDKRFLVSVMFANNEIGTIQPIKEISKLVHKYNGILHTDAVQAYMHTKIDVQELKIDLMSASFHKISGLKGAGFLYVRTGIQLTPLIHGGKQFNYIRSGTENLPIIYAFGKHVDRLTKMLEKTIVDQQELYNYLTERLCETCFSNNINFFINGHFKNRLKNNLSITFPDFDADKLIAMLELENIFVSAGSACCVGEKTPSRVLKVIKLSDKESFSTIRISFNTTTTFSQIDMFITKLIECLRSIQFQKTLN